MEDYMKFILLLMLLIGFSFSSFALENQAPGRAPASSDMSCEELSDMWTLNLMTMYKTADGVNYRRDQDMPKKTVCKNGQMLFTATASFNSDVIYMKLLAEKVGRSCKLLDVASSRIEKNLPKDSCL